MIFDLGGVLIDWNPRHLYRKLIPDTAEMERFLAEVCTRAWHERQDAGGDNDEATETLVARHPEHEPLIRAWYSRFDEMMHPMPETESVLRSLHNASVPLFAITNWPAAPFPPPADRFGFMDSFRDVVVSGRVGCMKPDPAIYAHVEADTGIAPERLFFIDDRLENIAAAARRGWQTHHFEGPRGLAVRLVREGLLQPGEVPE